MDPSPVDAPISVLVVDDEELLAKSCTQILASDGYSVTTENRARAGLESVRRLQPAIVLTDLVMPDMDGIVLLKEIVQISPETMVIMITGFATVDSSLEAIRAGAYDYIPKPFTATQLRILIGRAAEQIRLRRANAQLKYELRQQYGFEDMIGSSDPMRRVFSVISRVAPTEASVLISGESGTGKELIARAIHCNSRRSEGPFVAVNCAALPDNLLESELFGYEKGAFTGADAPRRGLLESAGGGTFFLDEISEMSLELQAKLLRVVQERRIRRVGGEAEIPIDVRWISATNRDPDRAVKEGQLRQDLLFRLNVVPIRVPPLRDRPEDIPLLAHHFLKHYGSEYGRPEARITSAALQAVREYSWPGNVRELQNVMERMVSLSGGDEIGLEDVPEELFCPEPQQRANGHHPAAGRSFHEAKADAIEEFEREYLRGLLNRSRGNISQAARQAGIDRKTIHRMLVKYELQSP